MNEITHRTRSRDKVQRSKLSKISKYITVAQKLNLRGMKFSEVFGINSDLDPDANATVVQIVVDLPFIAPPFSSAVCPTLRRLLLLVILNLLYFTRPINLLHH